MERYEAPFTLAEYRAAMAEQDRLKAEKDEAQMQEVMARAGETRALQQLAGAVSEAERLRALLKRAYPALIVRPDTDNLACEIKAAAFGSHLDGGR